MQTDPTAAAAQTTETPATQARRDIIASVRKAAAEKLAALPNAANSHDFLYDENGLPG